MPQAPKRPSLPPGVDYTAPEVRQAEEYLRQPQPPPTVAPKPPEPPKPPPPVVKFKYIVQTDIKPPTFVLFVKNKKNIPPEYIRYLINGLIEGFSLTGVVPKLIMKEEKK